VLAMEVNDDPAFSRVYARFVVVPSVVRVVDREDAGFDRVGRAGAQSREESLFASWRVRSSQGGGPQGARARVRALPLHSR
jgi:hypothetical protein